MPQPSDSRFIESMLKKGPFVVVSLTVAIVAAEVALQLTGRFPTAELHSVSAQDYARIPGMWEPNQDVRRRTLAILPYRVRTNSLGLRGPETTLKPHRPRVLCIGDSFTFGDFVEDDESLPAQLQLNLGPGSEVLNGGVGGTTIVDQHVFLERMLILEPQVVLLIFSENDLEELLRDPPFHAVMARNRVLKSGRLAPLFQAFRDTALFNLLLRAELTIRWRKARAAWQAAGQMPKRSDELVARYAKAVGEMRDMLHTRQIELVFTAFPSWYRLGGHEAPPETVGPVLRALRADGIDGIDLTLALRAKGLSAAELYLLPHDGHPSRRAYAIAAEAIAPRLHAALDRHLLRAETKK